MSTYAKKNPPITLLLHAAVIGAFICIQANVALAAEDYSQWLYYRNITLNTKATGAGVTTTQKKFPVLIRLSAPDSLVFRNTKSGGADIRFSESGNTAKHLPYQVERWDSTNKAAEIWVLADSVKGNDSLQYMRMFWGNIAAADSQKSAAVFDTGNGFAGVWHLGEGSGNLVDATINGITDTAKGIVKYQKTGGVGYSDSITGATSYFKAGDAYNTLLNMSARKKVTISAWVNRAGAAAGNTYPIEGIAGKYKWVGGNYREYCLSNNSTDSGFSFFVSSDGTTGANETAVKSGVVPTLGTWYFVTGVMDGVNASIFVNGALKKQKAKTVISSTTTAPFKIGLMDDDGGTNKQYFNGEIDEVIVSDTNRSADWIKLSYQNQQASQTLVKLEPPPSALSYSKSPVYFATSGVNTPDTARFTGRVDTFFTTPALPNGLTIDAKTGIISGVPAGPESAGTFTVTGKNAIGSAQTTITITVYVRPSITSQPLSDTVAAGTNAVFSITASGTVPLSYQWTKNGSVIAGNSSAATNTLLLPGEPASDDGTIYKCVARSGAAADSAWSNPCTLRVKVLPAITLQPISMTINKNGSAIFMVKATGSPPLSYQWTKNGSAIAGAGGTMDTLNLTAVPVTDNHSVFACRIKTGFGDSLWSVSCTLHVINTITSFSYSQKYLTGVINTQFVPDTAKDSGYVTRYSISPPLPTGLNLDTLTGIISGTPTVQLDSTGYVVAVSNDSGGYSTANISIRVFAPAKITSSPVNSQTVLVNGSAKFGVAASGSMPYSYAWISQTSPPVVVGSSDTLTLNGIDTTLNNMRYKCIVLNVFQNNTYFDTSKACTLHVVLPPKITQQPASQTVSKGNQAVFSVVVGNGTPPFSYTWIKNGTDTAGSTANSNNTSNSLTLASVSPVDDKTVFRCTVRNPSGADISVSCTLHVVRAAFSGSPQTGIDSLTVTFIDSSTGGVSAWQWDFGDGALGTVKNPTHKYTAPGSYSVKLKALAGIVLDSASITNFIVVSYSKPKPAFSGTPLTARDSITVNFTDMSTGTVSGRQWNFGDGASFDTAKTPVHTYKQPGSYTVALKVTGPGGADSLIKQAYVFVYSNKDNPLRLAGRRLSTTRVELTFSNYDSIATSKTTLVPPWADSLGLWFRKDSLPSNAQTGTLLQTVNLTALQAAAKPFKDTVVVPASLPADSVFYGFGTALYWNDGTKSAMLGGNGTLVLMKDTVRPSNGISISGRYLGVDTIALDLDNVSFSSIDTGKADSIAVWYGLRDSVNFSDVSSTTWFPVKTMISGAVASRYTYKIRDPRFNGDTVRVYAAVEIMGKNLMLSIEKDTSFRAGRIRPINPIKLKAKAISSSAIRLTWNRIAGFDRIRIWKGSKAVPVGPDSIPPAQFDTLIPGNADTMISATNLLEKHWYYFGAQVLQNGLWSKVTDSASAKDSTPAWTDTTKIANTIKIRKFVFDATRNALFASWHVDTLDTNLKVGLEYSLKDYPLDSALVPTQLVTIKSKTDSAMVKLNEPLRLNAAYYLTMWISKNGTWALPTDSSKAKTTTPSALSWQVVSYFSKVHDTVTAFGGSVILANESASDIIPSTDTLRIFAPPVNSLNGLVPVSVGFSFTNASDRLNVGLEVDTLLLPKGSSLADVRIYRQDTSGLYSVEYGTVLSAASGTVWVLTKDLGSPFVAMVDTMAPVATLLNPITGTVKAGAALYDTIQVTDNILNASWVFQYAKGADSYKGGGTDTGGTVWGLKDTVIVRVGETSVSSGSGVRALFVASDAAHFDTVDASRQVLRDGAANILTTVEMKWTPLWVTAQLKDSTVKTALKDLGGANGWTYDKTKFRLYRWLSYDVNSADDDKWIEYADSVGWIFDFVPGNLFWVKTKTHTALHLGDGVTADLRKPSTIVLPPQSLSDVSMPYDFSVLVGDIIESTDADSRKTGKGDSLQYYRFMADTTGHYYLTPLYVADWIKTAPQHMNKADSVKGIFCVYNPFKEQVKLRIPGIPASMSKQTGGLPKRDQAREGWSVQVVGRIAGGGVISPVYCGHSNGSVVEEKFYPAMPLIDGAGIRVCDRKMRQWGHEMAQGLCEKDGGITYLLAFSGKGKTPEQITFHVEGLDALPAGFKAVVMDPASDTAIIASAKLDVSVSGAAGVCYRKLVIGNDSYLAKARAGNRFFRLALVGVSPNPFGRMLRIRYSLPYGGIGGVEFSIMDLRGRQLWASQGATGPGLRELAWNGAVGKRPVASGMYVLRMKALDMKGKTAGTFEKRITYLP